MNLHLTDWLLITAASWSILAIAVGVPIGKAMAHADKAETDAEWLPGWVNDTPDDLSDAGPFDPFWWLDDDDTVASVINEMEGDFR